MDLLIMLSVTIILGVSLWKLKKISDRVRSKEFERMRKEEGMD